MTIIHAVHGFLGLARDWEIFDFPNLMTYDLYNSPVTPSLKGFWEWAQRFNQQVKSKDIFLGYSLGGRLGMHALLESPTPWKAAIIVSSNPGIKSEEDKAIRLAEDLRWAYRFETEVWEKVVKDWNAQSVFGGVCHSLIRNEEDFSRKFLSFLLTHYSLGRQEDLTDRIQKIQIPILWISGKNDHKFHTASRKLSFINPKSKIQIVPEAGHRVPWEQPSAFKKIVHSFLQEVL